MLAGALGNGRSARPRPADPSPGPAAATSRRRGRPDPFAPPSLVRSRTEPIPWIRTLLEFTHPALAIVGIGMWIGFTLIHQKILGVIAGGILLGAAAAGTSWYLSGKRGNALAVSRRTLTAHAAGAVLALALIVLALAQITRR